MDLYQIFYDILTNNATIGEAFKNLFYELEIEQLGKTPLYQGMTILGDSLLTIHMNEPVAPIIISYHNNFTVECGYTGQDLSWTAIEIDPYNYTIDLQCIIVAGPTAWTSGNAINYNIPDGFVVGSNIYTINFSDLAGNSFNNNVNFTVKEETNLDDDDDDDSSENNNKNNKTSILGPFIFLITILTAITILNRLKRRFKINNNTSS